MGVPFYGSPGMNISAYLIFKVHRENTLHVVYMILENCLIYATINHPLPLDFLVIFGSIIDIKCHGPAGAEHVREPQQGEERLKVQGPKGWRTERKEISNLLIMTGVMSLRSRGVLI